MARIKGFLKGARGKLADFVLQKGSEVGSTIMREKVTPANPQSQTQMATRLAFGTATNAAKILLPVIGESFAGVKSGKMSRREFIRMNIPWLRDEALKWMNNDLEVYAAFSYKGNKTLLPNKYIVSNGSLVLPEQFAVYATGGAFGERWCYAESNMEVTVGTSVSAFEILNTLFSLTLGDQITTVLIYTKLGTNVVRYWGDDLNLPEYTVNGVYVPRPDWQRYVSFTAKRLVIKPNTIDAIRFDVINSESQGLDNLKQTVLSIIDTEKSDPTFVDILLSRLSYEPAEVENKFIIGGADEVGSISTAFDKNGWTLSAAGCILSSNSGSEWNFSNCKLAIAKDLDTAGGPEDNPLYYGPTVGTALATYNGYPSEGETNFMTTGTDLTEVP